MLVLALPYAGAVWLLLTRPHALAGRAPLGIILGAAVVARATLLPSPPDSTDVYRYVWDGRVQAAGINPYRYRPVDPALAELRDTAVYPNINRAATAVTAYPPAAEILFYLVTRIADSVTGMKTAMVLLECAGVLALMRLLADLGLPQNRILLYAWHPLPLFEFAGSGHIDAAAIACMLMAALWAHRCHPVLAGTLLALGTGVKFFPAFIAPALWQRWNWRLPATLAIVLVALYLPYAIGVGSEVFGYLPGYVQEEQFDAATGVWWLSYIGTLAPLPAWLPRAYLMAAAAALLVLGLAIGLRRHANRISPAGGMILLAAFTLSVTPHYAWYFTWTVPFLCLRPSISLNYLAAASPFLYGTIWPQEPLLKQAFMYVPVVIIFAAESVLVRRPRSTQELPVDRHIGPQPTA